METKFLHMNNKWDLSLFIKQDISEGQIVDCLFWICRFCSKLSYHIYQQRVWKFLFLIRTFLNMNSKLMCEYF